MGLDQGHHGGWRLSVGFFESRCGEVQIVEMGNLLPLMEPKGVEWNGME